MQTINLIIDQNFLKTGIIKKEGNNYNFFKLQRLITPNYTLTLTQDPGMELFERIAPAEMKEGDEYEFEIMDNGNLRLDLTTGKNRKGPLNRIFPTRDKKNLHRTYQMQEIQIAFRDLSNMQFNF